MKYVKATAVLPEKLVEEIQQYIQGATIYIPKPEQAYEKWGARSGGRKLIDERNRLIKAAFKRGTTMEQLADQHHLSVDSIKKIVYSKQT